RLMKRLFSACRRTACETPRKLGLKNLVFATLAAFALIVVVPRAAQPEAGHEPAAAAHEGGEETPHEDSIVNVIARLVNFGVLAGALVYFLRAPLMTYLSDRGSQIRADLVNAEETKRAAAAQIEE